MSISSGKPSDQIQDDKVTEKCSPTRKCPKCGYERTQKDDAFISVAECPKCGVIYKKEEERLLAKEILRSEEELKEKGRQQNTELFSAYEAAEKHFDNLNLTSQAIKDNTSSSMKNCPYCAEEIKPDAVKCRYCGEWLNQQSSKQTAAPVKSKASDNRNSNNTILSKWKRLSWWAKVPIVCLVIYFVGVIIFMITDNNREGLRQQSVQKQRVQEQATETQLSESESLLNGCVSSCSQRLLGDSGSFMEKVTERNLCISKCEQDALTRKIEIRKLQEMQRR